MASKGRIRGGRGNKSSKNIKDPQDKPQRNYDNEHPHFSFRYIQKNFCLTKCEKDEQASLALTIFNLSKLKWKDLKQGSRHGLGCEKIKRKSIKPPIPGHITADVTYFLAFRFFGKAPMIGYRVNEVFHILWLDRTFDVYDH